ncbi:unnamed protein product [Euphydryas editha]|uniref:Uncharacterized protein n=1 Tax=Euphydryas editha TaxID=104508 RepID=A0AAU9TNB0_EUPED|nr:unnamed protein product [Euphydryas editha]
MNAKVGRREVKGTVGKHGLGERNDRGDRLVQFCQDQDLVIMNTYFQLPPRRLYTWTSPRHRPDQIIRNQINYIMINSNSFSNGVPVSTCHNVSELEEIEKILLLSSTVKSSVVTI